MLNALFDFFLPRICASCNLPLNVSEKYVCSTCLSSIKTPEEELLKHEFERKFLKENFVSGHIAHFIFEKDGELQNIIHKLKYSGSFRLGFFLGKITAEQHKEEILGWNADLILPIPLHNLKKAERGYNQSFFIAKGIKSVCGIPVSSRVIKRKRYTETQTQMDLAERKDNIQDAFVLSKTKHIKSKRFILVDDVVTTGATVSECAKKLIEAGADKVFVVSVAIAE